MVRPLVKERKEQRRQQKAKEDQAKTDELEQLRAENERLKALVPAEPVAVVDEVAEVTED